MRSPTDVTQHVGHVGRRHLACRRGLVLERMRTRGVRLLRLGAAPDRSDQRRDGRVGLRRDEQVDGRQALVVHAPAVVQVLVERHLDDGGRRRHAAGFEGAAEVDPVEAEDHVGFLDRSDQVVGGKRRREAEMQRMVGRERRADLEVGHDPRVDCFGELDALLPIVFLARHAAGQDQRLLGIDQQISGLLHQLGGRALHHRRHVALGIDRRQRRGKLGLLHLGVEIDVGRAARRGVRHPVGAQHRLAGRARRRRLVVPLGEVADDRALVGGGMDPVDPRPALHRIDRTGCAEDQDRHAVAPGVEDRHGRVEQADVGVHRRAHRLAGDLGIAVRDRHRRLLVQAEDHLRLLVAEEVDDRVVQAAIARAGIERDIRDIERAQRLGDDVAAKGRGIGAVWDLKPLDRVNVRVFGRGGFRCHVLMSPGCLRPFRPAIHTAPVETDGARLRTRQKRPKKTIGRTSLSICFRAPPRRENARKFMAAKAIRRNARSRVPPDRTLQFWSVVYFCGFDDVGVAPSVPDAIASSIDFLPAGSAGRPRTRRSSSRAGASSFLKAGVSNKA